MAGSPLRTQSASHTPRGRSSLSKVGLPKEGAAAASLRSPDSLRSPHSPASLCTPGGAAPTLLMREAHAANEAGEPALACEFFSACYALTGRLEARVSAANMTLKLGEAHAALGEYNLLLSSGKLSEETKAIVVRKRDEAEVQSSLETLPRGAAM